MADQSRMTQDHETDEPYRQGGGRIQMRDDRVSRVMAWLAVTLGSAFVTGVWIAANNLFEINRTLAANAVQVQWMSQQIAEAKELNERQEEHINAVDRRVYTLEGRNMRSGPDAETRRGR